LIVAGPAVDPDRVDPAPVDQDMHRVPRMVLVARAGRCIPHGPSPAARALPVDDPPLARRGLVLVRAPASVRLVPAQVAQAV
jgi:hypothetical protein